MSVRGKSLAVDEAMGALWDWEWDLVMVMLKVKVMGDEGLLVGRWGGDETGNEARRWVMMC